MYLLIFVLSFILFITVILLVIGLISPRVSLFWYKKSRSRIASFVIYLSCCLLLAIAVVLCSIIAAKNEIPKGKEPTQVKKPPLGVNDFKSLYDIDNKDSLVHVLEKKGFKIDTSFDAKMDSHREFSTIESDVQILTDEAGLFDGFTTQNKTYFTEISDEIIRRGKKIDASSALAKAVESVGGLNDNYIDADGFNYNLLTLKSGATPARYTIAITNKRGHNNMTAKDAAAIKLINGINKLAQAKENKRDTPTYKPIHPLPPHIKKYSFEVDSYTRATELKIVAGDKLKLNASGSIVLGMFAGSGGPEGIDGYQSYCIEPNFRHGSLLFKVGSGDWQLVNGAGTIVAEQTGFLKFMVNDSDPSNNSGSFRVTIKVTSQPKLTK